MQESNKIEIKPGVELKFRYGMAAPDNRPGFKGYHWGDVRVLSVRGQNVDLEQKQAGEWKNKGLVSSIPYLQHMQNEYKQMGTKSKPFETKKTMKLSELRQIIREEIQKILHENFISFNDLENAIKKHKNGVTYYDETRLKNMFNQLKSSDQSKAQKKYSQYFGFSKK